MQVKILSSVFYSLFSKRGAMKNVLLYKGMVSPFTLYGASYVSAALLRKRSEKLGIL